jgi:UDP-N-acetylmuramoyl-tripeptide--D-alanyl-D-alanine ligase
VVIDNPDYWIDDRTLLVPNGLKSLQELAGFHRKQFKIPVLAITGTNGKTTTKELITSVLQNKYRVCPTSGNLNNHIGVPLTLLKINHQTEIAVIEMGASHIGEIALLSAITQPTHGIITNIGIAHLEGFGSFENIVQTKTELYDFLRNSGGKVFINSDDQLLMKKAAGLRKMTYSRSSVGEIRGTLTGMGLNLQFSFSADGRAPVNVSTHLTGNYNLYNALAAVATGFEFQVQPDDIVRGLEGYTPSNMRSQWIITQNNKIILDAYNANPVSMSAAIENLRLQIAENKTVIIGDMLELGEFSGIEHQKMTDILNSSDFSEVFLVGKEFGKSLRPDRFRHFANTGELIGFLQKNPLMEHLILVKGSRGIQLERVVQYL